MCLNSQWSSIINNLLITFDLKPQSLSLYTVQQQLTPVGQTRRSPRLLHPHTPDKYTLR